MRSRASGIVVSVIGVAVSAACGGGGKDADAPDTAAQPRISCPKNEVIQTLTNDESAHHDRAPELYADAVRQVKDFHFLQQPDDCASARVAATQIQRKGMGSSDEVWVIQACNGECFQYLVNVKPLGRAFGLQVRLPR